MIGGYGNDWISGGTGADGIIGDDGRIFTSRNSLSADSDQCRLPGQPRRAALRHRAAAAERRRSEVQQRQRAQRVHLHARQHADRHDQCERRVEEDRRSDAVQLGPELQRDRATNSRSPAASPTRRASDGKTKGHNDDIIFGGLGSDWMHGGSGDDAISGAEALKLSYTQIAECRVLDLTGIAETDYYHPFNPGDALRFNPTDPDGKFTHPQHRGPHRRVRALRRERSAADRAADHRRADTTTVIALTGVAPAWRAVLPELRPDRGRPEARRHDAGQPESAGHLPAGPRRRQRQHLRRQRQRLDRRRHRPRPHLRRLGQRPAQRRRRPDHRRRAQQRARDRIRPTRIAPMAAPARTC